MGYGHARDRQGQPADPEQADRVSPLAGPALQRLYRLPGIRSERGGVQSDGHGALRQPKYVDKVWKLIQLNSDGSFSLNMDYFSFHHSTEKTYNSKFAALFGTPRPSK